ncbi:MAG: alanine racemase, partial [Desulfobulbaceae bacterium]|nr:alanine racemase [Desulfobulbaceae bacterium]
MNIEKLDTPCVIIDDTVVEKNIHLFQKYINKIGITLRPHIKTHKLPSLAKRQLSAGAIGINCQKVSEAHVFADAGIDDILITFNVIGSQKIEQLYQLTEKARVTVVADNEEVIQQLSRAFTHYQKPLSVLVECDTGGGRCGVQSPQAAAELASRIKSLPNLLFKGLLTFPGKDYGSEVNQWFTKAKTECENRGLEVPVISFGGTPGMWRAHEVPVGTEYRVGTYIYNDRSIFEAGVCKPEDCALTVLTTVVSCPTENRVVIDAGSKALTSDLLGMEGYGYVKEYPHAKIYSLSEEHGCIDFSKCEDRPKVG